MKNRSKFDRRSLVVEGLEERRVLAASVGWDGPGQGSADLTYYIGQAPNGMSQSTFEAAIESALKAWSDVADVNFTQTNQAGLNNSLDFTTQSIDGSGGTLAQAYFPSDSNRSRIAGDVQFDSAESWEVGNSRGVSAFDIVFVAVHEIGHALGLDHSSDATAVLYPSVSPTQSFVGLDSDDISAIRSLYAAESGSTSTTGSGSGTDTSGTGTSGTPMRNVPTRTTQFTNNSWFANFHRRFGGFRGGLESLDSNTPVNHNLFNPLDVNSDSNVSPADALLVINVLNDNGKLTTEIKVDTNGDGQITPLDALLVINGIGDEQSTTTITINLSGDTPLVSVVTTPIADDSSTNDPVDDSSGDDTSGVDDTSDSGSDDSSTDNSGSDTNTNDSGTDDSGTDDSGTDDSGTDDSNSDSGTGTDTDTDDNTDSDDDTDVPFDDFGHHHHHRFAGYGFGSRFGLLSPNRVDALFDRFDDNADELLTEGEVPSRLWDRWIDDSVDANDDSSISVDELNAAVRVKQQTQFDALDDDSDGLLTETEVSARLWTKLTNAEADTNADSGISLDELLAFQETASNSGGGDCGDDNSDDNADDSSSDTDDTISPTMITIITVSSEGITIATGSSSTLTSGRAFQGNVLMQMAASLRSMGRRFR